MEQVFKGQIELTQTKSFEYFRCQLDVKQKKQNEYRINVNRKCVF